MKSNYQFGLLTCSILLALSGCGHVWHQNEMVQKDNQPTSGRYYYMDYAGHYYYRDNTGEVHRQSDYPGNGHYTYVDGKYIDNSPLAVNVREALQADSLLHGKRIQVKNSDGVIELSGSLTTPQQERAMEIARNVPGVVSVFNAFSGTWF